MKAAEHGHSDVIKSLLDFGANATLRNHDVRIQMSIPLSIIAEEDCSADC